MTAVPVSVRIRIYFGAAQDRWFVRGRRKTTLQPWYQSLVLGNFPILRGGGRRALSYAQWLLGKGHHVFLFPEGTRATDGQIGEFKHGATLLALESEVPVVPVYLGGLEKLRPKGQLQVTRGTARIEFLKPVKFSPGSEVKAVTELLRDRVNRAHQTRTTGGFESEAASLAA